MSERERDGKEIVSVPKSAAGRFCRPNSAENARLKLKRPIACEPPASTTSGSRLAAFERSQNRRLQILDFGGLSE